jgi:microcystin-dependent protein
MGQIRIANDAVGYLAQAVRAGDTRLVLDDASAFPALKAGDWCNLTIGSQADGHKEVVKCTNREGSQITCQALRHDYRQHTMVALQFCVETLQDILAESRQDRIGRFVWSALGARNEPNALCCDGAEYSRSDYHTIYTMHGPDGTHILGPGNGSTTFNIPDARGRFVRMVDDGAGIAPDARNRLAMFPDHSNPGDVPGSIEDDQNREHTHTINRDSLENNGGRDRHGYVQTDDSEVHTADPEQARPDALSSSGGAEARPKNIALRLFMYYR